MKSCKSLFSLSNIDKHLELLEGKQGWFTFVDHVKKAFQLEDFIIYFTDPADKSLTQYAVSDNKRELDGGINNQLTIPYAKGIVGASAKNKRFELINDTSADRRYIQDDKKRFSELTVPIVCNNVVLGVIDSESSHKGFFKETHVQVFKILSTMLVPYVKKVKKHQKKCNQFYYNEFIRLMEEEQLYKNAELTLSEVAKILDVSETYLSNKINHLSPYNFKAILNRYRIKYVKKLLLDPKYQQYNLLAIALEAGFSSKSTFNRVFKLAEGETPSVFLRDAGRPLFF